MGREDQLTAHSTLKEAEFSPSGKNREKVVMGEWGAYGGNGRIISSSED